MRWEDERYVRVYTRDTAEWIALGWEAQSLFLAIMRKVDRAGILPLGKTGTRGLAGVIRFPIEVVERALPLLLEDGCVARGDGSLIIPNFILAQETSQSDKARQREKRERDRCRAMSGSAVTKRDSESQNVTESHAESRAVTSGHAESHDVTPSRAVPDLAEPEHTPPARAHEEQAAGQAGAEGDAPTDPDVPAVLAHLASMPPPVRHLASREYAERFVCAKMAGLALGDILAGITSAALKLGKHASATADQPETIASLADHVGGFVANQKRVGRRGGAIPLDDPDGVRRTQAYFGKAWEARKGRRYGAPDADLEHAVKLWDYAKKCAGEAKLKADGRDAPDAEAHVRSIVGQYLADDDRYVADRDHPIALLLSRLGRYGLPLAGARPATGPGIVIRPEDVAPIVRPPQPSADELRNMAATVAAGTGGAPLRRPSREAP